ncbi:hypothetical protein [Streptomyces sp. JHA26]|uniref:hypothetical protein n=1 Tax=Streptomyces sp. JHA26 TaxID=1917143 RepID=UPI0027D82684|nr:hypothetical protein [Streptomyces sp. JHA26]
MHVQTALFDGFDPLDVVAPYEVLYAGGTATEGAVAVEPAPAEGPREMIGGTGGPALHATAALDPERTDTFVVPGAGPAEAGSGEWKRDGSVPVPAATWAWTRWNERPARASRMPSRNSSPVTGERRPAMGQQA